MYQVASLTFDLTIVLTFEIDTDFVLKLVIKALELHCNSYSDSSIGDLNLKAINLSISALEKGVVMALNKFFKNGVSI